MYLQPPASTDSLHGVAPPAYSVAASEGTQNGVKPASTRTFKKPKKHALTKAVTDTAKSKTFFERILSFLGIHQNSHPDISELTTENYEREEPAFVPEKSAPDSKEFKREQPAFTPEKCASTSEEFEEQQPAFSPEKLAQTYTKPVPTFHNHVHIVKSNYGKNFYKEYSLR